MGRGSEAAVVGDGEGDEDGEEAGDPGEGLPEPVVDLPPWVRARTALTVTLMGWFRAKAWSQPGMVSMGTKAELAKISGKTGR
jgi:hypothetical protein